MIVAFTYKQYPGQQQVDLKVKIEVPGSWFAQGIGGRLNTDERAEKYEAIAVEYDPQHVFRAQSKGRGGSSKAAEAIRFICPEDAAEEEGHCGYWMRLSEWNRYRNDTYKERREDELPFLPPSELDHAMQEVQQNKEKKRSKVEANEVEEKPPVYKYFDLVKSGVHEAQTKAGPVNVPCEWYRCKKGAQCKVKSATPDDLHKVVKKGTSGLLKHIRACEGEEVWLRVRALTFSAISIGICCSSAQPLDTYAVSIAGCMPLILML